MIEFRVARIRKRTIWRLLVSALFPFSITYFTICGVFAFFGAHSIHLNGQPLTGVIGLISSPFMGAYVAGVFSVLGWVIITVGLWMYRFINPVLRIEFEPLDAPPGSASDGWVPVPQPPADPSANAPQQPT